MQIQLSHWCLLIPRTITIVFLLVYTTPLFAVRLHSPVRTSIISSVLKGGGLTVGIEGCYVDFFVPVN